jgi:hypothetical protein
MGMGELFNAVAAFRLVDVSIGSKPNFCLEREGLEADPTKS